MKRMRNIDKIKTLEKEVKKYQKKIEDQQKIIFRLSSKLDQAMAGLKEMQSLTDAVLANAAIACGEKVTEEGETIGYRLTLPYFSASETLKRYKIGARKDESGAYIIGVMERDDP